MSEDVHVGLSSGGMRTDELECGHGVARQLVVVVVGEMGVRELCSGITFWRGRL